MALYTISAQENLGILGANEYPGRVLVQGFATEDVAVQAYAIGGRSPDSRNRVLVEQDGIVSTEVFDKTTPPDRPDLTIYDAMRRVGSMHVVSNGNQTNTAVEHIRSGLTFEDAMNSRDYEDDGPNFTPRISGYLDLHPRMPEQKLGFSILSRYVHMQTARNKVEGTSRTSWNTTDLGIGLIGVGHALQTYKRNVNPLPSFDESPFALPIEDTAEKMCTLLWEHLNPDTRVAVAAKVVDAEGKVEFAIKNLHE